MDNNDDFFMRQLVAFLYRHQAIWSLPYSFGLHLCDNRTQNPNAV